MRLLAAFMFSSVCVLATSLAAAQAAFPAVAPAPASPALTAGRIGTFKQVEGEAWAGRSGARRAAEPGAGVAVSERLSTGRSGAATIALKDGTVLTMGPDTTLDLSHFQFDSTTHDGHFVLDLLQGTLRVVTGLVARFNPDRFRVSTPTSVVGVRGTDFIVETAAAH